MFIFSVLFLIQYVSLLLNFKFNKSFLSNRINIPIGVTTKKKIIPIIKGDINLPKKIPNLNHRRLNGLNIFEFNKPNTKNINEINNAQNLIE